MSVWICRAGKKGKYHDLFVDNKRVYLAWEGLDKDLHSFENINSLIMKECKDQSNTAINTHAGQVRVLVSDMQIGDYVITPADSSGKYSIGIIESDYQYDHEAKPFHHSRKVNWVTHNVERASFSTKMIHTLGAYRTIFALKDDKEFQTFVDKMGIGRK